MYSEMVSSYAYQPASTQMLDLLKAFSEAIAEATWKTLSKATIIGTINGGAAPPGGPVIGALCTFSPGSVTMPKLGILPNYRHPVLKAMHEGKVHAQTSEQSPWMKRFLSLLFSDFEKCWLDWFLQWSGTTDSFGGVAAWIPSTPPSPGPWTLGTITPLTAFSQSASSTSILMRNFNKSLVSTMRVSKVTINTVDGWKTVNMCEVSHTERMAGSIAFGIASAFQKIVKQLVIEDTTKSAASGTAMPGGIIAGGTITCKFSIT